MLLEIKILSLTTICLDIDNSLLPILLPKCYINSEFDWELNKI